MNRHDMDMDMVLLPPNSACMIAGDIPCCLLLAACCSPPCCLAITVSPRHGHRPRYTPRHPPTYTASGPSPCTCHPLHLFTGLTLAAVASQHLAQPAVLDCTRPNATPNAVLPCSATVAACIHAMPCCRPSQSDNTSVRVAVGDCRSPQPSPTLLTYHATRPDSTTTTTTTTPTARDRGAIHPERHRPGHLLAMAASVCPPPAPQHQHMGTTQPNHGPPHKIPQRDH
jgi:hypothetical protein